MPPMMSRIVMVAALLAFMTGGVRAGEEPQSALQLRGSTTLLPMAQRVAEAYMAEHPGVAITVSGGGSYRGYKAILDGTADIGLTSGPPTPELQKLAAKRSLEWAATAVGQEAVVAIVHPSNPLASLTLLQLQGVFSGQIRNWKELGWDDRPIEVFRGPPTGGLTELWRTKVMGDDLSFDPRAKVLDAAKIVERVAEAPAAIGVAGLGRVREGIKPLAIDGVAASRESILDGSYPVRGELTLVTGAKPSQPASDFIRYFVDPKQGLQFIDLIHAVPAERGK